MSPHTPELALMSPLLIIAMIALIPTAASLTDWLGKEMKDADHGLDHMLELDARFSRLNAMVEIVVLAALADGEISPSERAIVDGLRALDRHHVDPPTIEQALARIRGLQVHVGTADELEWAVRMRAKGLSFEDRWQVYRLVTELGDAGAALRQHEAGYRGSARDSSDLLPLFSRALDMPPEQRT